MTNYLPASFPKASAAKESARIKKIKKQIKINDRLEMHVVQKDDRFLVIDNTKIDNRILGVYDTILKARLSMLHKIRIGD